MTTKVFTNNMTDRSRRIWKIGQVLFGAITLCLGILVIGDGSLTPTANAQQNIFNKGRRNTGPYSPNDRFIEFSYVPLRNCYLKAMQHAGNSTDGYGHGKWSNFITNSEIRFRISTAGFVYRWNGYTWGYHGYVRSSESSSVCSTKPGAFAMPQPRNWYPEGGVNGYYIYWYPEGFITTKIVMWHPSEGAKGPYLVSLSKNKWRRNFYTPFEFCVNEQGAIYGVYNNPWWQ